MKEHPLIDRRDAQGATNLLGVPAVDVTQRDHRTLRNRELGDCQADHLAQFLLLNPLGGEVPRGRRFGPVAGVFAGLVEPSMIDCRVGPISVEAHGGKRHDLRFPLGERAGLVHHDPKDPRLQRRSLLELVDRSDDGNPRLLDHLLGKRARQVHPRDPEQQRVQVTDEDPKRRFVTGPQRLQYR